MYPDDKYRTFLLGMADEDTEASVEEEILDGRMNLDHLCQIEEELIDDHLFERLSREEERFFRSKFLSTPERADKLRFAVVMHRYSALRIRHRVAFEKPPGLIAMPWLFPLAGALTCTLLITLWLGERNFSLNRQLIQSTLESHESQRQMKSMMQEQNRRVTQSKPSNDLLESKQGAIPNSELAATQPVFRLSPRVSRGPATVQVLRLNRQARTVSIVIELPFNPLSTFREELLSSEDKIIWSQQFSSAVGIADHGSSTIVLPAGLFLTGEYRLRVETGASAEETGGVATYLFRVRKD